MRKGAYEMKIVRNFSAEEKRKNCAYYLLACSFISML